MKLSGQKKVQLSHKIGLYELCTIIQVFWSYKKALGGKIQCNFLS